MTLRIHLLGPAQISRDDVPLNLPGHRPLALLAYLLVTGKPHSRQHLVDLLFDGPDDPRAALRWTLSKLRQAIGAAYILADRQQIAFNDESDYWLDVTPFEGGQLELYRGDFLEGLHLREAFAFEDWLFFEREQLRSSYQSALAQQLVEVESQGDDPAIIETAHELLRLDNLREDWYRALMRAYARQGKRDAALAQFSHCHQVLQAELGVEPIAETVALAEAIRQGRFEPLRPDPKSRAYLIAGRYIIDDLDQNLLGQGNMGQVYQGRDTQTNQAVAIKVIKPDIIASQPHLVERFIREGEALRQLNHPHIVKMLAATEEEGRHYLIMEYVEGGSLQDLLNAQGQLPLKRTLEIALDLADALTRAHRLDIIHRDLKPANVLLADDGTPRLADFGIARLGSSPQLTQTGLVLGTVDYISPEACEGKRLDSRADIWAFGVLIYEMLVGQRPFTGDSLAARLTAILTHPVPDLTKQRPDIPNALANLIYRMLDKEPLERIPSVRLVGAELEAILQGREVAGQELAEIPSLPPRSPAPAPPRSPSPLPPRSPAPPSPRSPTSLVGRTAEMDTLRQAWREVVDKHGQIVLVDGEPGIGKTRLIEELLAEVAGQAVILRAKCPELESPLAYTLLADPLREALSGDRPSKLSDTWLAEVSRILPELRDRYPNLPQPESLDPAAERRRLFDAVCATLVALTAQRPLLLFEDDLQWADATSLELLNHLSGRLTETPVLILGTYRSNEVGPDHPLQRPRRDWQRTGLLTELSLEPLSDEAVVALLRELTTWPGDEPSFGDLVYRETAGNPLFVVETVASLRDEGRLPQDAEGWHRDFRAESVTIPTQVQTLIETRLNRLDDLSRQIGTTAAILRGSFTAEVVQTVSGRNEWETLEGLEQLLASGLLVEQGAERFSFSHDKIREVAYHSLSQLRRKLLHRRVAETLEKRYRGRESTMAERLAYHYEQADVSDKALVYHTQAGDKAREQYAHEAAIDHYQKALSYLKEQDDYETAARMLMKLGLLYHNIFDFQQARRAYEEGFALRRKAGEMKPATLPPAPHPLRLVSDNPPTLDPAIATDTTSEKIIDQLFSGLVRLSPDLDVMPEIAKSWEVLGGGSSYLFHLRDDMRWNDGVPVTAEDFVYAWQRVLNPATNSPNAGYFSDIKGASAFHQGQLTDPVQVGVRALGAVTLLVELEGPTGYFPQLLTCPAFYPVPRHIVEVQGQAWTEKQPMVTNGPFQLEAWQQGQSMVLSRNPDYRGRFTGNVQRLELSLDVASPAEQLAMYEANRLDMVTLFPSPEADRIRQQWAEGYFSAPWLETQYILFNMRKAPFNDLRVRRAFAMAIDKETLANLILRGFDLPASGGIVPPGMPGHSPGIGLPYKPDEARRLLAEAGYPSGQNFPVLECLAYSHELEAVVVDYLQQQWRENLGVEIRHRAVEWGTVLDQMDQGRFHLARNGWTMDYPDPDNILRVATVSRNWSGWRNETFIALVEEARRITNQVERLEVYRRAEKILVEEAAWVPLTYRQQHLLVKPWVRRYSPSAIDRSFWEDIVIEPHDETRQSRGDYGEGSFPLQRVGKSQPSTSPPAARVLRLAWPDKNTLDPVSGMWHIYDRLFSGLVAESPESEVEPEVARSWEILEGGRKYLFHLRTDVRWSDGVLLTAVDFEYAWKRVLDPATGAPYASLLYDIKRARAFHLGEISDPDQVGVQALDDVTLAVELEEPTGYFLHLLTNATMLPVPRHIIAAYGDDWAAAEHVVTNGPFRIEAWRRGESMVLVRDPDYHGRFTGNVERIELMVSPFDPVTNLALYEANRLDVFVDYHSSPDMDRIRQQKVQEYVSAPWLQVSFIWFDLGRPPFDDPRVRRAFALAIDREKLANVALRGDVLPATGGFVPLGMPGHSTDIALPYDPAQARRLLAEAGYPQGDNFPVRDWLLPRGWERMAEYLRVQWRENLGIALPVGQAINWEDLGVRQQQGPPPLLISGEVAEYPDPDCLLRGALVANEVGWRNETYTGLVEQARHITDQEARLNLYHQADKILVEESPIIPLTYGRGHLLVKPRVRKYPVSATNWWFWQDVIVEPH